MLPNNIVVIATKNRGKAQEFASLFHAIGKEVRSLVDVTGVPDVVEDGATFAENALKKAKTVALELGVPVIADDSGLCVDALEGQPGIFSARYAGEPTSDKRNNEKLLGELSKLSLHLKRVQASNGDEVSLLSPAQFVCALAYFDPQDRSVLQTEGSCQGFIASEPRGNGGFGYDPLFYVPAAQKTMAELTAEEKNQISHRAQALEQLAKLLKP